jgi:uncharacterized membrane protein
MIDLTHLHSMPVHFPVALFVTGFLTGLSGLIIKREYYRRQVLFINFRSVKNHCRVHVGQADKPVS